MPDAEPVPGARAAGDRTGILLVNLGTPEEPTAPAVRRYLCEFLSDPRVVETPRWLWLPVLHGFVLRVRPARSAAAYRKIWMAEGSPLLVHSRALAAALKERLSAELPGQACVRLAMSYGNPAIGPALDELLEAGARRIIVLPLYPQYSSSTTGAVFDAVARALIRRRVLPELSFINQYHDAPEYVAAVAARVGAFRKANGRGERLLFSFHGLPRRMVDAGDPYRDQCLATARAVAAALGLAHEEWQVAFQSRVGREEWLRPYTDELLRQWAEQGTGNIDIVCPGFATDCLETLEEIAMQNAALYAAAGGGTLRYIPALNAGEEHVRLLAALVLARVPGRPAAGEEARASHRAGNGGTEAARDAEGVH